MTTDAAELTRLNAALLEVQAAKRAIINENATQVQFDGRIITRPALSVLESEEGRLTVLINDLRAKGLGGDYFWGRSVKYERDFSSGRY